VQTFLPLADFEATARVLDRLRLGKQRVEALQILRALTRPTYGWKHHPAVRMWAGCEAALVSYSGAICAEWCRRGSPDTCLAQIVDEVGVAEPLPQRVLAASGALPTWLGDAHFHRSHQSALVSKDPGHYRVHFPDVPDDLPYVWPVPRKG
jgi:hypothetical protein